MSYTAGREASRVRPSRLRSHLRKRRAELPGAENAAESPFHRRRTRLQFVDRPELGPLYAYRFQVEMAEPAACVGSGTAWYEAAFRTVMFEVIFGVIFAIGFFEQSVLG